MSGPVNNDPPPVTQADIEEHTIQALIELVYVREANELIEDALGDLYTSIAVTSDALQTLTTVQNLHNLISAKAKNPDDFDFDYTDKYGDPEGYSDEYNDAASAYFGDPIDPFFIYDEDDEEFDQVAHDLKDARTHIGSIISALAYLTPGGLDGTEDPTSLLANLRKVYNDLDKVDLDNLNTRLENGDRSDIYDSVEEWVLDSYDKHSDEDAANQGKIQQRITLAITASENLNNSQTESVRSYMFVFEEYYKSAAGLLTKISQLIEKMAQSISR